MSVACALLAIWEDQESQALKRPAADLGNSNQPAAEEEAAWAIAAAAWAA